MNRISQMTEAEIELVDAYCKLVFFALMIFILGVDVGICWR